jgi:hypothetical protein
MYRFKILSSEGYEKLRFIINHFGVLHLIDTNRKSLKGFNLNSRRWKTADIYSGFSTTLNELNTFPIWCLHVSNLFEPPTIFLNLLPIDALR